MLRTLSLLAALGPLSHAAALPTFPQLEVRQSVASVNASLGNVTIFATGGTIAGSAGSGVQTTGYTAGAVAIQTLIDAVPELLNISNINGIQVANVDSGNINATVLLELNRQITAELAKNTSTGAVITHGTDTLEETAFFLDLTIESKKPVVVVGAMRPSTATSADGPLNLYQAVTLAVTPEAESRGTMVTLNDRIDSAFYVVKNNANSLDTFKAIEQGHLGFFLDSIPQFYYSAATPAGKPFFDLAPLNLTSLPHVDILYGHQDSNPELIRAAAESGAEAIVLAGTGAGGWTTKGRQVAQAVYNETGIPMVFSTRTMNGFVSPQSNDWAISSGNLDPQKARILLQCALAVGYNTTEIADIFDALQVS
ncbi:L-asparaginase [Aureobasidium pullulans]|uniref:asparaginase n=1 Tax=Aureobasidium pullulans TaxID=5580 RepID=A0A4S9WXE4_AURPU|nr:L-asparaginase [Aureobasidium pullulans]